VSVPVSEHVGAGAALRQEILDPCCIHGLELQLETGPGPAPPAAEAGDFIVAPMEVHNIDGPSALVKPVHVLRDHASNVPMTLQGC